MDLAPLMEAMRPICRLDPARPAAYRNDRLLRAVLRSAIPAMCFDDPAAPAGADAGSGAAAEAYPSAFAPGFVSAGATA